MVETPGRFRYTIRAILGLIAALAFLFAMIAPWMRPAPRRVAMFAHPHPKAGETMKSPSCTTCHQAATASLAMNSKPVPAQPAKAADRTDPHAGLSLSTRDTKDCRVCHAVPLP